MNRFLRTNFCFAVTLAWCLAATCIHAQVTSRLSSRFLARGEKAVLEVAVLGARPTAVPLVHAGPEVKILSRGRDPMTRMIPGRRFEHYFEFEISSYEVGDHVIPAIEVETGSFTSRTDPIGFRVFNPDELQWNEALMGAVPFRYASTFLSMNARPYEGETTPTEIKLYIPMDLFIDDWGIPDLERDGLTAWRFQPNTIRGQANLLGRPFWAVSYPSTLTPTRSGPITVGPAKIRLVSVQAVREVTGLRRVPVEMNVEVPKLDLEARPLPAGAPDGFDNAVGEYRIATRSSATEVTQGDPVPVEISVTGAGNLDSLHAPIPLAGDGWKVYDATREERGDERRELSGSVVFHQFLRPLQMQSAIPSFQLVYFNPKTDSYETATSDPIPLRMTPATALPGGAADVPPAADIPVERMTDILGLVRADSLTLPPRRGIPGWVGHLLGALLALGLVGKALWMRFSPRLHKDPDREQRRRELRELERLSRSDSKSFLMSAGRFVERWLGESPPDDVLAVLAERDAVCFRQERDGPDIGTSRRSEILRVLKRAVPAVALAITCLAGTGSARAEKTETASLARTAYDEGRFDDAAALWLGAGPFETLAPDTLYNIGNACYRADSPGLAALYYRRTLVRDADHGESLQNLRFIERKFGSISVTRPEYQDILAKVPLGLWRGTFWTGTWLAVLSLLVFPATRPGARVRVAAMSALLAAPLLMVAGGFGWRYFPDDAAFAPLSRQAVVVREDVVVHADAARTSPEVIDAPPGSICELLREAGRWSYISFANRTRGWVPSSAIERVIPVETPQPPELRKPKADGKSA